MIVVGNVWGNGTDWCVPGATMNRNVWVADYGGNNGRCPSTAESNGTLLNTYPYVNSSGGSAMDYHLTGSNVSGLDNFVETSVGSSDLATDWDGQARPIDTALGTDCTGSGSTACRDAGADER